MKNAFAIVTLSGLLSACALAPHQQPAPAPAAPAPAPETVAVASAGAGQSADSAAGVESPAPEENLPNVPLTRDLMYKLMKAELEFRNGDWQGPFMTMMAAAQQTRDPRLARRAAEMALASKQGPESLAAVSLWRELAPASDEAAQYFLGFVILSDNIAPAEEIFRRRLQDAAPGSRPLVMFQAQQLLSRAKDKAAASAMIERLVRPYSNTSEAHVVLAQTAFAGGASEQAIKEAQAALALKPDSEIAVLTLAQVTEDEAKVAAVLEKFLASNPAAREVRAAHARVLVSQKQYDRARQEFLTLLKGQPDNLGTLYALGIMSMQLNDPVAAEQYLSHFIEVLGAHPDDERDPAKVLMMLSQLAEERGDFKAAVQWVDKVDDNERPAWFAAQLRHAQLIGKQGDLDAARAFLDALKAEEPSEQAQIVATQGQILREAGKIDQAYVVMEAGVKRYPSSPDLLYDFALLAEKTGRVDVMEKTLREVIAQAPDNHHAYNALGYSLAERNVRLPEALELIGKALKMAPGDPFIMDSMGWVLYRLGNLNAAEAQLRQAYALRSDPEIAVHLGEVLWQKGQKADAQKLWREARAKDPKNDTLKSTLARLHQSL